MSMKTMYSEFDRLGHHRLGLKLKDCYGIMSTDNLWEMINRDYNGDIPSFLYDFGKHRMVGRKNVDELAEFLEHDNRRREGLRKVNVLIVGLTEVPTIKLIEELGRRERERAAKEENNGEV